MKRKKVKLLFVCDKSQMKSTMIDCYPTINSLCSVIPRETREHMHRVGDYSEILFRFIYDIDADRIHKELGYEFEKYSKDIFKYHDIGRVYIPFAVLNTEGIETDEQKDILLEIGCDIGQGYYFSKPVDLKTFDSMNKTQVSEMFRPDEYYPSFEDYERDLDLVVQFFRNNDSSASV